MASKRYDVAILGAGIFGLSAAYSCARSGRSTIVFDKNDGTTGASYGLLGVMSPYSPSRWSAKKAFQLRALTSAAVFWRQIEESSGLSSGYARVGRCVPLFTAEDRAKAEARSTDARENWGEPYTLTISQPTQNAPFGYAEDNLSARIAPRLALAALRQACVAGGAEVHYNRDISIPEALNIAEAIVIAAGDKSRALLPEPSPLSLGVKGQAALLATQPEEDSPIVAAPGFYVVDHPGIGTAIGSTSEKSWTRARATDAALDELIERACEVRPDLRNAQVIERWAGVRPRGQFPDPVIGQVPAMDRVWLMSGGYGIGFGVAHELGWELANMLGGAPGNVPPRFSVSAHLAKNN